MPDVYPLTYKFTAENGKKMTVIAIFKGNQYGLEDSLTHTNPMPLIAFFTEAPKWPAPGYQICRYYLDTLIERGQHGETGLCLDGSNREYDLTAKDMAGVHRFLVREVLNCVDDNSMLSPRRTLDLRLRALTRTQVDTLRSVLESIVAQAEQ